MASEVQTASATRDSRNRNNMASQRKNRSRRWPERSDEHDRIPSLTLYQATMDPEPRPTTTGLDSGRNMMAIFEDIDETPRLKWNIEIRHGRKKGELPDYPDPREVRLPVGLTLEELCKYYPLHCWGDGLRIFMAEGWTAEQIFNELPRDVTTKYKADARRWNFLQQALGREADKMFEEAGLGKRKIIKRKRDASDELDGSDASEGASNDFDSLSGSRSSPFFQGRVAHSQLDTRLACTSEEIDLLANRGGTVSRGQRSVNASADLSSSYRYPPPQMHNLGSNHDSFNFDESPYPSIESEDHVPLAYPVINQDAAHAKEQWNGSKQSSMRTGRWPIQVQPIRSFVSISTSYPTEQPAYYRAVANAQGSPVLTQPCPHRSRVRNLWLVQQNLGKDFQLFGDSRIPPLNNPALNVSQHSYYPSFAPGYAATISSGQSMSPHQGSLTSPPIESPDPNIDPVFFEARLPSSND